MDEHILSPTFALYISGHVNQGFKSITPYGTYSQLSRSPPIAILIFKTSVQLYCVFVHNAPKLERALCYGDEFAPAELV